MLLDSESDLMTEIKQKANSYYRHHKMYEAIIDNVRTDPQDREPNTKTKEQHG